MAKSERTSTYVIGHEVGTCGAGPIACGIDREGVTNIRMIRGEAVDREDQLLAPGR